ncbi:MAG: PDZ domain-containing protein [Actinomycetes bacterium]
MTRQTWTAAVAALLFVLSAAVVAMMPVPFVTFSPGSTHDLLADVDGRPAVEVEGLPSHQTTGEILLPTVAVTRADAPVSLPEVLYAHWAADRDVFPREAIYAAGSSATEIRAREAQLMAVAQSNATASALRAAGVEVRQIPMVQSVASAGPAVDKLFPGDFVLEIDGKPTPNVASVREEIEKRSIGESVTFTVLRDRQPLAVTLDTAASKTQAGVPVWGGNLVMGYSYAPRVEFGFDDGVGGSSAGLMMAMAVFDLVTPESLTGGRIVAGTGAIDGAGNVSAVSGVRERLAGAEGAGAEVFLVPSANCVDLVGVSSTVRVVSVSTLDAAINSLDALADPATQGIVRGCQ